MQKTQRITWCLNEMSLTYGIRETTHMRELQEEGQMMLYTVILLVAHQVIPTKLEKAATFFPTQ